MKYLQDYQEDKQTELFNETGAFFCFSQKQFDEGKKEGIKYTNCGHGMVCNSTKVKELLEGLENIHKEAVAEDLKENGKDKIIVRELYNYESFYTGDISDAFDALKVYGFTEADVIKLYNTERHVANA